VLKNGYPASRFGDTCTALRSVHEALDVSARVAGEQSRLFA
jgi:hypothetical protein